MLHHWSVNCLRWVVCKTRCSESVNPEKPAEHAGFFVNYFGGKKYENFRIVRLHGQYLSII